MPNVLHHDFFMQAWNCKRARGSQAIRAMGHEVTVSNCGLLVNPAFPWLGASPDRIAYDPTESSYGVVEIKCPYSLRNKKLDELSEVTFCSELSDSGPCLKRDHFYYAQHIGQMGVSGLTWGDFVIFAEDFILIERLRLDQSEWEALKVKLDRFYFTTLLPYLECTQK